MKAKSEKQIERDFYSFVKQSVLGQGIRGTVYRPEMRPANAQTEDLVVKFLAGLDEQIQSGVVLLNIYVPDVPFGKDGRKVEDMSRVEAIETLIQEFVDGNEDTEYWMQTDTSPTSMKIEGIEQHLITARIKFNRLAQ